MAGVAIETVGEVVSGGVYVTVRVSVAVFPAASRAVTVRRFVPAWRTIPLTVQLVVPLAVPLPPRSFVHVTWVTPTLSEAAPPRPSGLLPVLWLGLEVGEVMDTVGDVIVVLASLDQVLSFAEVS